MNTPKAQKGTWQTVATNLLKNAESGRYYGRFKVRGKQKWVSLKTDKRDVAERKLREELDKIDVVRSAHSSVGLGGATVGDLATIYREQVQSNSELTDGTKTRYLEHVLAVERTWPELFRMKPQNVTKEEVVRWRDRVRKNGTGFVPPGAKGRSRKIDGSSPESINKMIDAIRRIIGIAVERRQITSSPLIGRGLKLTPTPRKPKLPERDKLNAIFANIESRGLGRPLACAELCRFLAYTGCRKEEAAGVTWGDVDLVRGIIRVRGTKTEAANREVPLIAPAKELLETIKERRLRTIREVAGEGAALDPADPVLLVNEAEKALTRACGEVGAERLTHHDLRDVFATTCIEAGVDIPTVAAWLGHKDGGALLMRTYAHHRRAHSLEQAAKVKF